MRKNNGLLRSARLSKQWTEEFVSEQVGVKLRTYVRWETGIQLPRYESLKTLCRVFSMSPTELGFLDPSPSQQDAAQAQVDGKHVSEDTPVKIAEKADDEEETIEILAEKLALCWEEYISGEQIKLEILVPTYIADLNRPTLVPGPDQRVAASLMSQAYQLIALLELQRGNTANARLNGTQAVVYAQLARDWNVYVAAQVRLAT